MGLFFFYYSEFRASASLVLFHFQVCGEYGFFSCFFYDGRNDVLSGEFIPFRLQVFGKYLFHEPIFERVECYDRASSSFREKFYRVFQ